MLDRTKQEAPSPDAFLAPAPPHYAAALERWFWVSFNAAAAKAGYGSANRLCLAMLAYGAYVDRFLDLTLPSLLAPGNLAALDSPIILVHTDDRGVELLRRAAEIVGNRARFEIHVVPQDLLDQAGEEPSNKYWLLGCAQQLQMQMAKCMGYDYHMLYPDVVYARDFFENLIRLAEHGKQAIVLGGLTTRIEKVAPIVRERGHNIAAAELNAIGLDHLHQQMTQFVVNGRAEYPSTPLFLLAGAGALHYVCPHYNIIFLAHALLHKVPLVLFNTVDAALPQVISDEAEVYAPQRADGIAWIEVSDQSRVVTPELACDLGEMAVRFWVMVWCNENYLRYLDLDCEMALPDGYVSPYPAMTETAIASYKETLRRAVRDSAGVAQIIFPMVADAFQRGRHWK